MALNRTALDNFYAERKPYLEEIIGMDFQEHPMVCSAFLNMKSASSGWVDGATVSGMGLFQTKAELVDAASDDVLQGPTARVSMLTYAKQHLVSQEAIEDDEGDGIIASRLPAMLRAGRATQEVLGHDVLNSGFSAVTTPDGAALFSTAHVNLSGTGSLSNRGTAALSHAAIEAAILALESQTDDRNIPIFQKAQKLVVPNDLRFTAAILLESDKLTGAATYMSNEKNVYANEGLQVVSTQFMTDANNWFLLSDDHKLDWYWRVQPENWSEVDYVKAGVRIGARFRCATGAWDWRGAYGAIVT